MKTHTEEDPDEGIKDLVELTLKKMVRTKVWWLIIIKMVFFEMVRTDEGINDFVELTLKKMVRTKI